MCIRDSYQAGLYYLQEPSAMTPASRIPVEPGEYVLDMCAAPGGKATAVAFPPGAAHISSTYSPGSTGIREAGVMALGS